MYREISEAQSDAEIYKKAETALCSEAAAGRSRGTVRTRAGQ